MKKRRNTLLAAVLAFCLLFTIIPFAFADDALPAVDYSSQYIDLSGDWNFKVYRKYSNMYQYMPYDMCEVTWEDAETALVPTAALYSQWETVQSPAADYSTGGLLQMYRGEAPADNDRSTLSENELFPNWSEAWFCKTVSIPEGFLQEETVTLLLGVIDDLDVVYVNGTPVAASGFINEDGQKAAPENVPADGGFLNHGAFSFEKSYWEVSREYQVPAELFKEGDNELCIRIYNNNSFGGFYDRTLAVTATRNCVNFLKNLPIEKLENTAVYEATVNAQIKALEGKDLETYSATLCEDFQENELDKSEKVAQVSNLFEAYNSITVTDTNGAFYFYDGRPVYFASRTITGEKDGETVTISALPEMIEYFDAETGLEQGNMSHCYKVKYVSHIDAMNGKVLEYSIYLPPTYYKETDRRYPVVYLLHGINSTGDSFVNVDHIEDHMNEWIASGDVAEMIVVMPNSGKSSFYEDREVPADGSIGDSVGPWASHIYADMIEEIDGNYRTLPQAEFRGISGISMGGGGVFKVGVAHPEIYTSFASHMGAVPEDISEYLPEDLNGLDFYLDCGLSDQMVNPDNTRIAGEYLESLGANVIWELREGAHNSAFYMAGMPVSMKMHSDHFLANGLEK